MPLVPGTKVGPYEVTAPLGAGGMGEVYQATDTNLKRAVALKVLPAAVASDPDRLARFQREAEVLASLNHPHIAAVYGLERGEGHTAIVMELVEGPTLAERLERGPLQVGEALDVARQVAEALEAAHEHGIVHRDLKPANIKVRPDGTVKVLDFGLAKAVEPARAVTAVASQLPTITTPAMTQMGMILGTAAYMSPEQARGRPVDHRTDIWAFGCVLYEMLTGRLAFEAEDVSLTLARVLERDVDLSLLPPSIPARVRHVLRLCLSKDIRQRVQAIGDVRLALEGAFERPSEVGVAAAPTARRAAPLVLAVAVAGVVVGGLTALALLRQPSTSPRVTRFELGLPAADSLFVSQGTSDVAISPDGTQVVYSALRRRQWYIQLINQLEPTPLAWPRGAANPFFSPDGQWVAFNDTDDDTIKRMAIGGGPLTLVGRVEAAGLRGASWGEDGTIVFGRTDNSGLWRIPAAGGQAAEFTKLEGPGYRHLWPYVLPGGAGVLFTIWSPSGGSQIAVADPRTGQHRVLLSGGGAPRYLRSGHIVYRTGGLEGTLAAAGFDLATLAVTSKAVPMVEGVVSKPFGATSYDISRDGSLVYAAGRAPSNLRELVWVDRKGSETPLGAPARAYQYPRISPDGTRVALDVRDQDADIWIWDIARRTLTRLTFDPASDEYPVWTPDSRTILFGSGPANGQNIFWQSADGTGSPTRLSQSPNDQDPATVTPDGSVLLFRDTDIQRRTADIRSLRLPLMPAGPTLPEVKPVVVTRFDERNPEVSPDGRWLAYESDESGQFEVYVRPFPDVDSGKWQVSTQGGRAALWSRDGSELFFLSNTDNTISSVRLGTGTTWTNAPPVEIVKADYFHPTAGGRAFDVAADGQRFLFIKNPEASRDTSVVVVQNWHEEVKRLVPVP